MKIISILLIATAVGGFLMAGVMFGDIGVAASIGSWAALLSGIGFWQVNKAINKKESS